MRAPNVTGGEAAGYLPSQSEPINRRGLGSLAVDLPEVRVKTPTACGPAAGGQVVGIRGDLVARSPG